MAAPHDVPTAAQLVEAVREWIERDLMSERRTRARSSTPVSRRTCWRWSSASSSSVRRRLPRTPRRLEQLGVADDAELAAAIRARRFDDRAEELRALLLESVVDKLAVANPRYLG